MMRARSKHDGSGLILSLAVLAMLAVLATTFVSLSRLDVRVTLNYVDDQSCEMLARGTLNYFKALLRDDLDRTWGKYENRDAQVGMLGRYWNGLTLNRIPGLNTARYGTPLCNDFWFNAPFKGASWEGEFGGIYDDDSRGNLNIVYMQQSFASTIGSSKGVVVRFRDDANNRDFDAYTCLTLADYDQTYTKLVYKDHPEASGTGVDYDGDGSPWDDPTSCLTGFYYDTAPFVLFGGESYFQSG
ncbi:MAG TPA: hypothetical protein VMY39_10875, partial [Planctomycetota bacterium]|nr:hypothetical protein [Planctomycetota bacterium]